MGRDEGLTRCRQGCPIGRIKQIVRWLLVRELPLSHQFRRLLKFSLDIFKDIFGSFHSYTGLKFNLCGRILAKSRMQQYLY